MTNQEVVEEFARGGTWGHSGTLSIGGDKLYSYAMPIAKKLGDGSFLVSNAMVALGGQSVSQTTSCHIGLAHSICKPNRLVEVIPKS